MPAIIRRLIPPSEGWIDILKANSAQFERADLQCLGPDMSPVSSLNTAAVVLLQHASALARDQSLTNSSFLATANGVKASGFAPNPSFTQARAKVSEAFFGAQTIGVHQMKVNLMERLGDAFGIKVEDFETVSQFGAAVRDIVSAIKLQDDGYLVLKEVEKKLGLDKLGISLDTLVKAIIDPESSDNDKLVTALEKELGAKSSGKEGEGERSTKSAALTTDEAGLYSV